MSHRLARRAERCLAVAVLVSVVSVVGVVGVVQPGARASAADTLLVSLVASTGQVAYGDEVSFVATATQGGAPLVGSVELLRTGPDGVQAVVGRWTPDAVGAVAFADVPTGRSTYQARAVSFTGAEASSSPVPVDVRYAVAPAVTPTAVPPGGRLTAAGSVAPAGEVRTVRLEQRLGAGAWVTLGTAAVSTAGRWTFPLGTRTRVGRYTVRATVAGDATLSAGTAAATTAVTVTGTGRATAWQPVAGTKARPARWGTCRIGYRVNVRRMPATGAADLREAIRRVTQVSGIRFRYLGRTSVTPSLRDRHPGLNRIVVAWAPPARSGGLLADGIGGVGGTSWSGHRLVTGFLLMNSDFSSVADPGFGQGTSLGLVLMHELGHVVGLGHSPDQHQVMAPSASLPAAVWGAADLRGLRTVGSRCR